MHKVLERQLKRAFGSLEAVPPGLEALLRDVDQTYVEADQDRRFVEHSLELTSQELLARNDELRQKQGEQQVIFDSVPAMIFCKDAENRILRLNSMAAALFGMPIAQVEGKSTYDLLPHAAAKALHDDDLLVIRTGKPKLGIIESHPGPDGSPLWFRTDKVPLRDERGQAVGVIVLSVDITERRRAEDALREKEERYRLIVETATEGIWSVDTHGRTVFVNQVMADLLGESRDGLVGRHVTEFMFDSDLEEGTHRLEQLLSGNAVRTDWRFRRSDGTALWVQASGAPILDAEGRQLGSLGMMSDITDRRRAEDELRKAYDRLKEVDRSRTQFLNTAAHELGTPLTPLNLQLKIVADRFASMDPQQRRSIEILSRSVTRLTNLVKDLLDAARLQSYNMRLDAKPIDFGLVIHQAVGAFADVAAQARVGLDVDMKGPLPVQGDAARLGQVLDNLLSNAIKFSKAEGHVKVRAWPEEDRWAIVQVTDQGLGMSAEAMGRLFRPFSQVHDPMENTQGGTGLGLYISKGIIEQSGGTIEAFSQGLGEGSSFTIRLPLDQRAYHGAKAAGLQATMR